MKSLMLGVLTAFSIMHVNAQPVYVGKTEDTKIYMTSPNETPRFGNAVLIKVYEQMEFVTFEESVVVDCRGRWISDSFNMDIHFKDDHDRVLKSKTSSNSTEKSNYGIDQLTMNQSNLEHIELIKKNLTRYCSNAQERKGFFVPITHSTTSEKGEYEIYSLISSGGVSYKTHREVWIKIEDRVLKDSINNEGQKILNRDGKPIKYVEKVQKGYNIEKIAFNCKSSTLGSLTNIAYDENGQVLNQSQKKYNENLMSEVIPNTVGDALVEKLCKIYN